MARRRHDLVEHFRLGDGEYGMRCDDCDFKAAYFDFTDLIRHHKVKHCKNPEIFPCPVLDCKRSGANGFKRKDKLLSHQRNVHSERKKSTATKGLRVIQYNSSKAQSRSSASGSSKKLGTDDSPEKSAPQHQNK